MRTACLYLKQTFLHQLFTLLVFSLALLYLNCIIITLWGLDNNINTLTCIGLWWKSFLGYWNFLILKSLKKISLGDSYSWSSSSVISIKNLFFLWKFWCIIISNSRFSKVFIIPNKLFQIDQMISWHTVDYVFKSFPIHNPICYCSQCSFPFYAFWLINSLFDLKPRIS